MHPMGVEPTISPSTLNLQEEKMPFELGWANWLQTISMFDNPKMKKYAQKKYTDVEKVNAYASNSSTKLC